MKILRTPFCTEHMRETASVFYNKKQEFTIFKNLFLMFHLYMHLESVQKQVRYIITFLCLTQIEKKEKQHVVLAMHYLVTVTNCLRLAFHLSSREDQFQVANGGVL